MKPIVFLASILALLILPGTAFSQTSPPTAAADPISLEVFAVCQDVTDRTPLACGSVYSVSAAKLFCFTKVVGAQTHTQITHNWYMNGKLKASITLPVKSASWRTWSVKEIRPTDAGDWMVEVLNEAGEPIESLLFFIE